jgi:hypothetical protein
VPSTNIIPRNILERCLHYYKICHPNYGNIKHLQLREEMKSQTTDLELLQTLNVICSQGTYQEKNSKLSREFHIRVSYRFARPSTLCQLMCPRILME